MDSKLDAALIRLHDTFGAQVGRPTLHGGVVAVPTALALTSANLMKLEHAWLGLAEGADAEHR